MPTRIRTFFVSYFLRFEFPSFEQNARRQTSRGLLLDGDANGLFHHQPLLDRIKRNTRKDYGDQDDDSSVLSPRYRAGLVTLLRRATLLSTLPSLINSLAGFVVLTFHFQSTLIKAARGAMV